MTDKNGITIEAGQYIQIIGAKVKNDNGIYIVDQKYSEDSFCLKKVKQNGEKANAKYNIFFLDNNSIKRNPEMLYTVIAKDQLKAAAKEVSAYLKGKVATEKVYTFTRTAEQEVKQGLYIHIKKPVLFVGHINKVCGTYEITNVMDNGRVCLHLIGAKGEQIADNVNGYYQFTPIHLNFNTDTMKDLFSENYIEILERHESTKGEQVKPKKERKQKEKTAISEPVKAEENPVNETTPEVTENPIEKPTGVKKGISFTVSADTDTRTNSKIYVAKLSAKISREEYQEVNQQIKTIGGYYSRFKKGFIFKDDPSAKLKTLFGNTEQNHTEDTSENREQQPKEITPKYYPIDEQMAKTSRYMWSMNDYVPNSETESYKNAVNNVYDTVKQIAEQKPEQLAKALTLAERYSRKLAEWKNKEFKIAMMCPSVMISGAGNFPVRKKEKQNRSEDRHMEEYQNINRIPEQIEHLLSDSYKTVINSGDNDALDQLKEKLSKLQEQREQIKIENKQLKAKGEPIHASYILQNLGQNIRNVEQRIEQLERIKAKPTSDITEQYNTKICKVIENTDIMRLQLIFDGKPSDDIRSVLKSHGFRWSPYNSAWQRQLTNNAKYDARLVLKEIEKQEQTA
jgi:hypothetical protein